MKNLDLFSQRILAIALSVSMILLAASLFVFSIERAEAQSGENQSEALREAPPSNSQEGVIKTGYVYYTASESSDLQAWVMKQQATGWKCAGGINVVYTPNSKKWYYSQAMSR